MFVRNQGIIPAPIYLDIKGSAKYFTETAVDLYLNRAIDEIPNYFSDLRAQTKEGSETIRQILPELGLLLGTPGLPAHTVKECLSSLGIRPGSPPSPLLDSVAQSIVSKVASIAFSFSEWRFLAQPISHSSLKEKTTLLEQCGMTKLIRSTDNRSATTPEDSPGNFSNHDFGPGFEITYGDYRMELRRTYALVSSLSVHHPVTISARNSSNYFGRNRLPECSYTSDLYLSTEELRNLDRTVLCNPSLFTPLQNSLNDLDFMMRINDALTAFSAWSRTLGQRLFGDLVANREKSDLSKEKNRAVFAKLTEIAEEPSKGQAALVLLPAEGPTFPALASLPINKETVALLFDTNEKRKSPWPFYQYENFARAVKAGNTSTRLALLSLPRGDTPA